MDNFSLAIFCGSRAAANGQLGHMQKTCNETVYDSDAPPPAPPKSKRNKTKKKEATARPSQVHLKERRPRR